MKKLIVILFLIGLMGCNTNKHQRNNFKSGIVYVDIPDDAILHPMYIPKGIKITGFYIVTDGNIHRFDSVIFHPSKEKIRANDGKFYTLWVMNLK